MNIGLLVFLVSVAGMIGLWVYVFVDNRRREEEKRQFAAGNQAAHQANLANMNQLQSHIYTATHSLQTEFERSLFYSAVLEKLELIDLVAVPISDTWREHMKPDALARFMHENPGCKLRMDDGSNVVLYVPDEDCATTARLAL